MFREEIERDGGWTLVDAQGPHTLIVRGALIDLIVHAPPEGAQGRDKILVNSAAEVTLVVEIYDAQTRQILARVAERGAVSSSGGRPTRALSVNNRADIRL